LEESIDDDDKHGGYDDDNEDGDDKDDEDRLIFFKFSFCNNAKKGLVDFECFFSFFLLEFLK
jgi:hypothetical protein